MYKFETVQACFQSLSPCRVGSACLKGCKSSRRNWIQKSLRVAFPLGESGSDKRILKIDKSKDGDGFITRLKKIIPLLHILHVSVKGDFKSNNGYF